VAEDPRQAALVLARHLQAMLFCTTLNHNDMAEHELRRALPASAWFEMGSDISAIIVMPLTVASMPTRGVILLCTTYV
jgi:hypothetical protein